jgi:hypothetical protein
MRRRTVVIQQEQESEYEEEDNDVEDEDHREVDMEIDQDQDQEEEEAHESHTNGDTIPCEICGNNILFDIYTDHIEICIRHSSTQALMNNQRLRAAMATGGMRIRLNPQRTADDLMALNLLSQYMGMTLVPNARNEYEYNLWLQDTMGGNVHIGVRDKEAVTMRVSTEEVPPDTRCTICLESPQNPRKTTCDHYFCEECIFRWLGDNRKCPNCTIELDRLAEV